MAVFDMPRALVRDVQRSRDAHMLRRLEQRASPRTQPPPQVGGVPGYTNLFSPERTGLLPPASKRAFADQNEWMRAAIDYIGGRLASASWDIVPTDPTRPSDTAVRDQLLALLGRTNPRNDQWGVFIKPLSEDLIVLGKCGWEYVQNFRGRPLSLYPFDAAYMTIDGTWDGSSPSAPRYIWHVPPLMKGIGLRNSDVTMPLMDPSTHRAEGWSRVDTLKGTIEADMAGSDFVRSLMRKYPPPGWIHLGSKASQKTIDHVNEQLRTNVLGRGGMLVTGGTENPAYNSLWNGNSRDNELIGWSRWFAHKVAVVCGLSPQDLGLTQDVNKSTGDVQADLSSEGGVKGAMLIFEGAFNAELLPRFGDPRRVNLSFRFKELTLRDRARLAEIAARMNGGLPTLMINEARALTQDQPIELGNAIYAPTPNGPVALIGPDADGYRQKMADYARQNAQMTAEIEAGPNGKDAGGAGSKQQGSDTGKASATGRSLTLDEEASGAAPIPPPVTDLAAVLERVLLVAWARAEEETLADLDAYHRVVQLVGGLRTTEAEALDLASRRLEHYLFSEKEGRWTGAIASSYTDAGSPFGVPVSLALASDARAALRDVIYASRASPNPFAALDAALDDLALACCRAAAFDVSTRLWRHHVRARRQEEAP